MQYSSLLASRPLYTEEGKNKIKKHEYIKSYEHTLLTEHLEPTPQATTRIKKYVSTKNTNQIKTTNQQPTAMTTQHTRQAQLMIFYRHKRFFLLVVFQRRVVHVWTTTKFFFSSATKQAK